MNSDVISIILSGKAKPQNTYCCIPIFNKFLHSVQVCLNKLNVRSSFQVTQIQSYLMEVDSSKIKYISYDNYIFSISFNVLGDKFLTSVHGSLCSIVHSQINYILQYNMPRNPLKYLCSKAKSKLGPLFTAEKVW